VNVKMISLSLLDPSITLIRPLEITSHEFVKILKRDLF
jgi:hypothetical protein